MQQQPSSSPSCTVAGGAGGGGGGGEDPFDGIVFSSEFLRWLLNDDDDDGCLYRATTMGPEAEAEASSRFRAEPSSPSCTLAGGAAGVGEDPYEGIVVIPPEYLRWLLDDDDDGFLYRATTATEAEASPRLRAADSPMQRQASSPPSCSTAAGGRAGGDEDADIVIPTDLLQGLDDDDDDDGCLHGAAAAMGAEEEAEEEEERRLAEAQVGDHAPVQQPSSSPSCTVAGEGPGGDDDDVVIPPDYLHGLLDDDHNDDGSLDGAEDKRRLGEAHAHDGGDGGHVAEEENDGLSMTYRGNTHVFDSVPPHKVETILMLLNDYELAPQSAKPKLTNLVPPIVVPENFDRATAMSRYLKKRKSTMKADYSVRREIALRITRRGGKFAPSEKNSENSVGTEAAELQFCANCRESSEVTPQMRRGPTGAKNFCNACGLAWATYRKIRNVTNAESQHGGSQ